MAIVKIRPRRDTAANWTSVNPTLADGEIARETNTGRLKFGDGATAWTGLTYWSLPWSDVSDKPANLVSIAGLASAADRLPYFTGAGTSALATFTAAGRALVDDADAAAQRVTLGLGTAATRDTGTSGATVPLLNGAATTWLAGATWGPGGSAGGNTVLTLNATSNAGAGGYFSWTRDGANRLWIGDKEAILGSGSAAIYYSFGGVPHQFYVIGNLKFEVTASGASTPGTLAVIGHGTTANAANAYIDSGTGLISRSTSSRAYKRDVEPMEPDRADAIIQGAAPVWYKSAIETDPKTWGWWGLIAEDLAKVDPRLVTWGYLPEDFDARYKDERRLKRTAKLRPVGVAYERLTVPLLSVVQRLQSRLDEVERELRQLKSGTP